MNTKTYIEKYNTIINNSDINTGINPVSELCYGSNVTRGLIYFDHSKLSRMVYDKTFADISKLKHYLRITNCGSVNYKHMHKSYQSSISDAKKIRTSSFDLIFFLIPKFWDCGKGFNFAENVVSNCGYSKYDDTKKLSKDGCNWFQARNGYKWDEEGIFSNETLSKEYDKFSANENSIIIARQHFDIGNENINVDITDVVNKFISGELENYGIGIAYSPMLEITEDDKDNYVGFFTNKTNTFFEPYVETIYNDYISDDRNNFVMNKQNKLYLFTNIGGKLDNLDELPTCSIEGKEYEVKQFSKGIYYIDTMFKYNDNTSLEPIFSPNTMLYDVWDNIIYKGIKFPKIEQEFVLKSIDNYFNFGNNIYEDKKLTPYIYGIDYDEQIKKGDIRKINVGSKINYTNNKSMLFDDIEYRLYVKDGEREIDVINFEKLNKVSMENYFILDTNDLIPNKYLIDIKYKYNLKEVIHHDVLEFTIINDITEKYK